jgi:hypothetical protein
MISNPDHRLVDTCGRVVRDLRISVTDRCNLRCVYCTPAEGMKWLPKEGLLTFEEIVRFSHIALSLASRRSGSQAASRRCARTCPSWCGCCTPWHPASTSR